MKKLSILSIVCIGFGLMSCNKDSVNNIIPATGAFTYKADGGATITADSANAVLYTLGVPPNNRMIDVFVFKGGNQVMEMHFLPKTGGQTVSPTFADAWLTYSKYAAGNPVPTDSYDGTSGSFNLSVCDTTAKKLAGTFNFSGPANVGSGSVSITEGNMTINNLKVQ